MAQLAIAAVGALALGPVGLGLTTAGTGFMLGSLAYTLLAPGQKSYGPRLNDLKVTGTDYGAAIPWVAGSPRVAGQIIWASERRETATEEEQGKGGGASYTSYTYDVDLLILLSENPIAGINRVWSNGDLVHSDGRARSGTWLDMRVYTGADDQLPDPTYEAAVGIGNAPAYRGMGTVLIQGLQLGNSGNIPNLTFEIAQPGVAVVRPSVLCAAIACSLAFADANPGVYRFNYDRQDLPTWSDYFGEYGADAVLFSHYGTPGESGVLPTRTLRIDTAQTFRLEASNSAADGDICSFTLDFLSASGATLATVRSSGVGARTHTLQYRSGGSGGWSVASQSGGLARTGGSLVFAGNQLSFINSVPVSYNGSFTLECDVAQVTHVRISNVRVREQIANPLSDTVSDVLFYQESVAGEPGGTVRMELQEAVAALLERGGYRVEDFDADNLSGSVRALALGQVSNTRATLEALQQAFFFECSASDRLYLRPRSIAAVASIPFADLGMSASSGGEDEPFALTLGNDLELPAQLALSYPNMAGDYQAATEFSDRLLSGQQSTETLQTALGLMPGEAKAIVDGLLMDRLASLATATLKLPLKYAYLEPGDVINAVNSDGRSYRLRIQSKTDAMPIIELQCVLDDVGALDSSAVTDEGYVSTDTVVQLAGTQLQALDIPILRDADDSPGFYVALGALRADDSDKWPGALLAQAWDGVNYAQVLTSTAGAVMGVAATVLAAWSGGVVFDERSIVTVRVRGELASSTREAMLLDETINAMLLGREIIRFRTAVLISPGTYLLSGLLRGQRGTEWAMGSHAAGEPCVLLGASLRRVPSQTNEIGLARQLKAATLGSFLSGALAQDFTDTGVALKPFSPANPRALPDGHDLVVTWQRRTRRSYQYAGAAPVVPLGEASEAYRVRVFVGAALKRSDVVTAATYRYTSDMRVADGVASGTALQFEICQLSATVGPGYPSTVGAKAP